MSIKHKFITSSFWVVLGRGGTNISSFVIFALLARFLGPAEFGLVAFASIFIDLTRALALAGTPQALIQRPDWDDRVSSTAFWLNIGLAILFAVAMSGVVAPLIGRFYEPRLGLVLAALSITFVIDSARAAHEAKMQHEFQFKKLAARSVVATIIGGVVGVVLAFYDFGAWALVWNRAVTSLAQTVIVWWATGWSPKFVFSFRDAKPLLAFGLHLSGAAVVGQFNRRVPELVIGIFLGPTAVGFYRVGSRALNMLNDLIIGPMQATALTAFSRLEDPAAIGRAYVRLTRACGLLAFPLFFGTAAIAQDFVVACFGRQWRESGLVMAMLAIMSGAQTLSSFAPAAFASVRRTGFAFITSVTSLISGLIVSLLTVGFGPSWVALGISIRTYFGMLLGLRFVHKATGLNVREVLLGLMPPFLSATLMACLLVALRELLLQNYAPTLRMSIMVPLGGVLYCLLMLAFGRKLLADVKGELQPLLSSFGRRLKK